MTSADEERICDLPAPVLTRYVNLCDKYTLTIEEAAAYFGIGQKKIRSLVQTHERNWNQLIGCLRADGTV